jgi:hypothetical protein
MRELSTIKEMIPVPGAVCNPIRVNAEKAA